MEILFGGRPRIDKEVRDLIRRMSFENPLWSAPHIHGELLKLGFDVAQSTVSKYMVPRRGRPSQTLTTTPMGSRRLISLWFRRLRLSNSSLFSCSATAGGSCCSSRSAGGHGRSLLSAHRLGLVFSPGEEISLPLGCIEGPAARRPLSAMAVASMDANNFANALDRAIARSDRAKLIEAKAIENNR
jgi:hypothetical protein